MEITPQNQVPEQLDRKDMLLENLVAQGEKNHQESSALLENVLAQGADKGNTEPLLEASLEMQSKTHETMEEKGSEIAEAVKELKPAMDAASFLANFMQAIKGEKGDTPEKGKDYFTEEDKKEFAKLVEAQIKVPEDGRTPVKGQDYFTQEEIDDITDEILSLIPIPENGKDADPIDYARIISEVVGQLPDNSVDYDRITKEILGKVPKPEKPIDITESYILEKIKGKISYNDLKDIPTIFNGGKGMGGLGYITDLADVDLTTAPTNGQVLTYNSTTKKWYAGTGGGGGSAIAVLDEGISLTSAVTSFNFVGAGVVATAVGNAVTVTISGGGTVDGSGTANELAYWVDTDTLGALAVATYPSLTELSYVKGVTSAIQTQINTKANSAGALTQFVGNGNWKVWYSDGSGDVTELALGASGTFLKSNGASSAPTFATPATGVAIGDTVTGGTATRILYLGASNVLAQTGGTVYLSSDDLYFDQTGTGADQDTKAIYWKPTFTDGSVYSTFRIYAVGTGANSYPELIIGGTGAAEAKIRIRSLTGAGETIYFMATDVDFSGVTSPIIMPKLALVNPGENPHAGEKLFSRSTSAIIIAGFEQADPAGSPSEIMYINQNPYDASASAGAFYSIRLQTDTTDWTLAANWTATWATATHASRKGRATLNVYDTAIREGLRIEASGSAPMIGFLGATAVVRPAALTTQLTSLTHTAPGTPDYAIQDLTNVGGYGFVTKDEGNTVLSVILNLQTRVAELEAQQQSLGLLT